MGRATWDKGTPKVAARGTLVRLAPPDDTVHTALMGDTSLLIDTRARAAPLDPASLRAWAHEQRVFISSVMTELAQERRAAAAVIAAIGAEPVWFEAFGGRDADAEAAYTVEVGASTVYVGLLAERYGRLLPSHRSATHEEYLEAERRGVRIAVWVKDPLSPEGHQQSFIDEVRAFHVTGSFTSPNDLAEGVKTRLERMAAEDLSPWCKLGRIVFRAGRLHDDGEVITVQATVHDSAVVAALEDLRQGTFGPKSERLTYAGRSRMVRIKKVTTTLSNARTTDVKLQLEPERSINPWLTSIVFYGDYEEDDVTEIGLRKTLFGESGPRGVAIVQGVPDPVAGLRGRKVPEDALRSILHLTLTEALVGTGRAIQVAPVRLSSPVRGERRLAIEWQAKGAERPRRIDGTIRF